MLLFRDNKLEKTLTLAKEDSGITVGNVEWSADGKTLYMAYAQEQDNAPCRYGILEAPVDRGNAREIQLFTADSSDSWSATFQVAISPNGRTLAISSTCFEKEDVKSEERALYLVDLGSAKLGILQSLLTRPDRSTDKVIDQLFKLCTGQGHHKMLGPAGIGGDKGQIYLRLLDGG